MHLIRSVLVVALVTPLVLAGPRGNALWRRTGDDNTNKDGNSSSSLSPTGVTLSQDSSSVTIASKDQPSPSVSKDKSTVTPSLPGPSTAVSATASSASKDQSSSLLSKDEPTATSSLPGPSTLVSTSYSGSSTLILFTSGQITSFSPVKDQASSSSAPAKDQSSSSPASATDKLSSASFSALLVNQTASAVPTTGSTQPSVTANSSHDTGISSSPESTVEVLTTDIIYTTLTTCPVTSIVTSGSSAFQEVSTTVSTVIRTSISTVCTKCVAPPSSSSRTPSTSAGVTSVPALPSFTIYSLTIPSAGLPLASSKPEVFSIGNSASPSRGFSFPSVASLTVSATLGASSPANIPGYGIVPSPISTPGGKNPLSNATSSILPVFTPSLLGNGYGGGYVRTPSIYVTKLPYPYGPSEGVPPGYGFSSKPGSIASTSSGLQQTGTKIENTTTLFTGLGLPTSGNLSQSPGVPVLTAVTTSGVILSLGGLSFTAMTSAPASTSSTPTALLTHTATSGEVTVGISTPVPVLISFTASSGQMIVSPATPSPLVFVSSTVSSGEAIIGTSTASPTPLSFTASSGEVIVGTSTPAPFLASSSILSGEVTVATVTPSPTVTTSTASSGEIVIGTSTPSPVIVSSLEAGGETAVATLTPSPILVSSTASIGQMFVGTSTPSQILISSTTSVGEVIIGTSSPPTILVSLTASKGQIIVETPVPSPLLVSSTASKNEVITGHSAASPMYTSRTASGGEIVIETSTPPNVVVSNTFASGEIIVEASTAPLTGSEQNVSSLITPASATPISTLVEIPSSLAIGSPVEIGALGTQLTFPGESVGAPFTLAAGSPVEQSPVPTQPFAIEATILTPVVGANGLTSLAVVSSPGQPPLSPSQPAATVLTPIVGANGLTSLAVIPSPVVGANGLTSLAVFSTPIAAASGLTSPAVILTPVVGANGLTSLAVLATPIVGANGLTSLAIGLEGEHGSSGLPSPTEVFILATPPGPGLESQIQSPTPPTVVPQAASSSILPSSLSISVPGSDSNSSVHVPLVPSAIVQFEGSGLRLTFSFGMGIAAFILFLFYL